MARGSRSRAIAQSTSTGNHHPINHSQRLPPELLQHIFSYSVPLTNGLEDPKPLRSRNFDTTKAPWVFISVCRQWRDVTLSSQRLWSTIAIRVDSFAFDSTGRDAFYLKTVVARSDGSPMSVRLDSKNLLRHTISGMERLVDILLPTIHRWSFLELNGPVDWWSSHIPVDQTFSSLRELALGPIGYDIYGPGVAPKWPSAFSLSHAPQLRRLICREPGLTDCLSRSGSETTLPWSQLTSCQIDHEYDVHHDFHHLLSICPGLESFRLAGNTVGFINNHPTTLISHSSLTEWHCVWRDQKDLDAFVELLPFVDLPSLKVLTFWIDWDEMLDALLPKIPFWCYSTAFISFVERSSCSLRHLRLTSIPFDDDKLLSCLEALPSLEVLEVLAYPSKKSDVSMLHNGVISDDFITRLHNHPNSLERGVVLLPNLTRLILEDHLLIEDDEAFVNMVESRWNISVDSSSGCGQSVARLETVSLVLPGAMDDGELYRLDEMRNAGLDVCVYRRRHRYGPGGKLKQLLPAK